MVNSSWEAVKVSIKKKAGEGGVSFYGDANTSIFRLSIPFKNIVSHDSLNRIVPHGADSQHGRKRIIKK